MNMQFCVIDIDSAFQKWLNIFKNFIENGEVPKKSNIHGKCSDNCACVGDDSFLL